MAIPTISGVNDLIATIAVPTPFPVGAANVHVVLREPITLVDTGPLTDDAWAALQRGLKAHGLAVADVERVLLTHGHNDHFGLARRIAGSSKARVLGGRLDRRQFRMERRGKLLLDEMARAGFGLVSRLGVTVSVAWVDRFSEPLADWDELDGGETLPGDGYSIAVRAAPGHTPGSLLFEIPEAGVLFTGDTVLHRITPNAVVMEDPARPGTLFRSLSRYRETLDAIEEANGSSRLLTGHGVPIADFPAHRASVERRYWRRREAIEHALAEGPLTVHDIAERIFPKRGPLDEFLVFSELTGFLMSMEDEGRVERDEGRDLTRWRVTAPRRGDVRAGPDPRPAPAPARSPA